MTAPLVTILDDEPEIRTILSDALEEAGFRTERLDNFYMTGPRVLTYMYRGAARVA